MFNPTALSATVLAAVVAIAAAPQSRPAGSFYDLKTTSLDGKPADLASFRGKVLLAVNVASFGSSAGGVLIPEGTCVDALRRD